MSCSSSFSFSLSSDDELTSLLLLLDTSSTDTLLSTTPKSSSDTLLKFNSSIQLQQNKNNNHRIDPLDIVFFNHKGMNQIWEFQKLLRFFQCYQIQISLFLRHFQFFLYNIFKMNYHSLLYFLVLCVSVCLVFYSLFRRLIHGKILKSMLNM